jgi:acyl carrier protein
MEALIGELQTKIVAALSLEGVRPEDIQPDAPLFGVGLGLDSIDALELVAMVEHEYGIVIQDRPTADAAFRSLRSLAEFVTRGRSPCADAGQS